MGRTVIGEQQVQGIDYAYTLQGWLKGVNTTNIGTAFDMGDDGITGSSHIDVARDVYGFALHYFPTDYTAIKNSQTPFAILNTTNLSTLQSLYNGNIAAMSENLSSFTKPLLFSYGYDQLNRLI